MGAYTSTAEYSKNEKLEVSFNKNNKNGSVYHCTTIAAYGPKNDAAITEK